MIPLFNDIGVHCIVDGQFGSTGKGALAAWLAHQAMKVPYFNFAGCIYNGGPNSGHTHYFNNIKTVLKQLPSTAIYLHDAFAFVLPVYLSAGAVIDPDILRQEAEKYQSIPIFVHPNAAVICSEDKLAEKEGTIAAIAGTRSGTGEALARKIRRDPMAIVWNAFKQLDMPPNVVVSEYMLEPDKRAYFMEVSQGFSLGINSKFYPHVTSRECTVMQGLSDARIAPRHLAKTYMAIRTYPIRVGNVDGYSSGDWYNDQTETTWENIGVPPERTTVTNRIRRVADFSMDQFTEALIANDPDFVFISHMDYCDDMNGAVLIDAIRSVGEVANNKPFDIIRGDGPCVSDIMRLIP